MSLVSPIAMRVMFPLKMAIGLEADHNEWLYVIGRDAAALHVTAFTVEEFIRRVLRRQETGINQLAMLHFQKGLMLLRRGSWGMTTK